ncbi:MAG TPA: hypothetical protein VGK48_26235 [Terriglobia bacterium]|jgi:hypothetical protein
MAQMTQLAEIQSRPLDRADARLERAEAEDRDARKRHEELQGELRESQRELIQEVRAGMDRIFKLLGERPN